MATVSTAGIWTGFSVDVTNKQGINTSQVNWGVPYAYGQRTTKEKSGYQFDGVTNVQASLDGSEFKLGTFTHHNWPLNPMPHTKFSVYLKVTATFDSGGSKEFNYTFDHFETPGQGAADEVTFPNAQSKETVTLGGKDYTLTITGFKQDGKMVSKFISHEERSNAADIFAKLEEVRKIVPPPEKKTLPPPPPPSEEQCKVKAVVNTSGLLTVALERLNRRSFLQLIEQIIAEVSAHCEQQPGAKINITEITQQIEILNAKLLVIQRGAKDLDEKELGQINRLLQQLIQNIDLSQTIQNMVVNIDGRSFHLHALLQVISTVDQVVSIQIQYAGPDQADIAGAVFVLTDGTQIVFSVRLINQLGPDRVTYLFETTNWRGLPAQFSLVFNRRVNRYKLCNRTVTLETFDAVEQTNIVFDLCPQISKLSGPIPPPPIAGCVPSPKVESKSEFIPPPPFEPVPAAQGASMGTASPSSKKG